MNSGVTNGKKEKSKVFEMILCSPGMAEHCKISLKITRQNVLVLSRLIEAGGKTLEGLGNEIQATYFKNCIWEP